MYQCGDLIDQYRLTKSLGAGSYGVVFEAENTVSRQKYALKVIPLCGRAGSRELRALRQYHDIGHRNLLKIHHSGIAGDYLYYTMELADGKLADRHLSPAELRFAAVKLADALAALHEHGLIHRDIKPDNLLILNGEPLIGDIGLITADCGASLAGTPGFLPPAVQKSGAALSEYSDLYALAKSFYCLLSGNPPGNYPKYAGSIGPDSAILLQAILNVCDENGVIASVAAFRDFLKNGPAAKPHHRIRTIAGSLLLFSAGIAAGIAADIFLRKPPPSLEEQMRSAMQKAEMLSPAEQAAVERQKQVYAELKAEAKKQAEMKYPRQGNWTSIQIEVERQVFYEDRLMEAIRVQTEKSPEFRCFYLLRNEVQEAAVVLDANHPELTKIPKEFQAWQQKYTEYCKQRDRLLAK